MNIEITDEMTPEKRAALADHLAARGYRRAEIAFKHGAWVLTPFNTHDYKESSVRIRDRRPHGGVAYSFPTHAEALAHALHEVGLTPTNPEPMESP